MPSEKERAQEVTDLLDSIESQGGGPLVTRMAISKALRKTRQESAARVRALEAEVERMKALEAEIKRLLCIAPAVADEEPVIAFKYLKFDPEQARHPGWHEPEDWPALAAVLDNYAVREARGER